MTASEVSADAEKAPTFSGRARPGDTVFKGLSIGSGLLIFVTLFLVAFFLVWQAMPAIRESKELTGNADAVSLVQYTAPLVFGTVYVALLALLLAVPIAVGIAVFISHFAPRKLATPLGFMIDLLAAVPSVVFGLWGGVWLVPKLEPLYFLINHTIGSKPTWPGFLPFVGGEPVFAVFAGEPQAPMRNLATAAVVLAVMILPIITAVSREIFLQTPRLQEEAALALGATRWEMIRTVVFPFGASGVIAASMLGLGRALGETMAVLMILSPGGSFSWHIFEPGRHSTIAAFIASHQGESTGVDMARLVFAGLVLFVITFIINALARAIVSARKKG